MSWLDELVGDRIKQMPQIPSSPGLTFGFDDVRRVISMTEDAVTRERESVSAAWKAKVTAAMGDPSHQGSLFSGSFGEMWSTEMTFPLILRRSLFIAIYSHFEHALLRWCRDLQHGLSLKPMGKKLKGESTPHHYLRYIRDEASFALGDFENWSEWSVIDGYRLARNCLAHDGGIVANASDHPTINALPHIEVDESGLLMSEPVVHLLPGACEAAVATIESFLAKLAEIWEADGRFARP